MLSFASARIYWSTSVSIIDPLLARTRSSLKNSPIRPSRWIGGIHWRSERDERHHHRWSWSLYETRATHWCPVSSQFENLQTSSFGDDSFLPFFLFSLILRPIYFRPIYGERNFHFAIILMAHLRKTGSYGNYPSVLLYCIVSLIINFVAL